MILYILLSGMPPFWGDTEDAIFQSILKGKLEFESDPWPKVRRRRRVLLGRLSS